jgi:hypothetical protein
MTKTFDSPECLCQGAVCPLTKQNKGKMMNKIFVAFIVVLIAVSFITSCEKSKDSHSSDLVTQDLSLSNDVTAVDVPADVTLADDATLSSDATISTDVTLSTDTTLAAD